jgi:4-hydroxybenzoyl-CoA reductase subunit beta
VLPFPAFSLERPDRLDDLLDLAAVPGSRIVAGGTDLLVSLKHRLLHPTPLVSVAAIQSLRGIHALDDGLSIGASVSLREVARDPLVVSRYPALAEACATIATHTIQAMGTIGGNVLLDTRCVYYNQPAGWRDALGGCLKAEGTVCHVARTGKGCYAAVSGDTVPVLWLMGAELEIRSSGGERRVPIRELFTDDGRTWLRIQPGEVLVRIHLPAPGAPIVHRKLRARGSIDYPLLLVAVQRDEGGARAVLSALGPSPIEVRADVADELPEIAWRAAHPLPTHLWSTTWRKHMVRVEVSRALASSR